MVDCNDAHARQLLRSLFDAAVAEADPGKPFAPTCLQSLPENAW